MEVTDYSFGYVAGWSTGRELDELKTSLETIRNAAAEIIDGIDAHMQQLSKNRGEPAKEQTKAGKVSVMEQLVAYERDVQSQPRIPKTSRSNLER